MFIISHEGNAYNISSSNLEELQIQHWETPCDDEENLSDSYEVVAVMSPKKSRNSCVTLEIFDDRGDAEFYISDLTEKLNKEMPTDFDEWKEKIKELEDKVAVMDDRVYELDEFKFLELEERIDELEEKIEYEEQTDD